MSRKELASQLGLSEKALEGFSDETLNEMAQEAVEGGGDDGNCDKCTVNYC